MGTVPAGPPAKKATDLIPTHEQFGFPEAGLTSISLSTFWGADNGSLTTATVGSYSELLEHLLNLVTLATGRLSWQMGGICAQSDVAHLIYNVRHFALMPGEKAGRKSDMKVPRR
jgi:hypothetical protein